MSDSRDSALNVPPPNYTKANYHNTRWVLCVLWIYQTEWLPRRVNHPWQLRAKELQSEKILSIVIVPKSEFETISEFDGKLMRKRETSDASPENYRDILYYTWIQFHSCFIHQSLGFYIMYQPLGDRVTSHILKIKFYSLRGMAKIWTIVNSPKNEILCVFSSDIIIF